MSTATTQPATTQPATATATATATEIRMPAVQFRDMLLSVAFAADDTTRHYSLDCVQVEVADGEIAAIAADGRQLAVSRRDIDRTDPIAFLVPAADARKLASSIGKTASGDIVLTISANNLIARWHRKGDREFACHLAEGRFPRWRDLVREDVRGATMSGPANKLAEYLPNPSPAFIFDLKTGCGTFRLSGSFDVPKHDKVKLTGEVSICFDPELLRRFLDNLNDDMPVLVQFTESGPIRCVAGPTVFIFMPCNRD